MKKYSIKDLNEHYNLELDKAVENIKQMCSVTLKRNNYDYKNAKLFV